jgi:hypothetical protein
MRTTYPVVVVIAIAIASIMFSLSGAGALFGQDPTTDAAGDQLEDKANSSAINEAEGEGLDLDGTSSSDLIGFIIDGASAVASVGVLVLILPVAMQNMGFPYWFAFPLGLAAQILVSIGLMQFITGRELT